MKSALNPYLPEGTYIPDGEPHVFDGRVYIYGSHDLFDAANYCEGDYEVWSAPVDDLTDWKKEGIIFPRKNPANPTGEKCMWAPDVCRGADGKFYLYFCFAFDNAVQVAVCDTPAGTYSYLGTVHHPDGTPYGQGAADKMCFDPGVYCAEDGTVYLYSGFCPPVGLQQMLRSWGIPNVDGLGSQVVHLARDMCTVLESPKMLLPGMENSAGTGFQNHAFFEASSIRRVNGKYYLIYSSEVSHELCYATSDNPDRDFSFGGVLISNGDIGYGGRSSEQALNYWGNNHGSIEEINGKWYLFYHRQTNRGESSRQGCAEAIELGNGIAMVQMTSQGLSGAPLPGVGSYGAYTACNLFSKEGAVHCGYGTPQALYAMHPAFTQEYEDGKPNQFIGGMRDGSTAGFKYFAMGNTCKIGLTVRGAAGRFEIRLELENTPAAVIPVEDSSAWHTVWASLDNHPSVCPVYVTYRGAGAADFKKLHFAETEPL